MITKNQIADIKSLSTKKGRVEHNQFVCEGEKICREFLQNGLPIDTIYYTLDSDQSFVKEIVDRGVATMQVSPQIMSRISQLKTPATMLGVCNIFSNSVGVDPQKELVVVLDTVQDPGNLGTIIRVCDWFGIKNIVCSEECADIFSPKVVQATMGAISRVNVLYTNLIKFLEEVDVPIYGTFLEGDNIYSQELSSCGILIMGNEGRGVSVEVANFVNQKLFIPPYPKDSGSVESLNVSIATAICLSEFRRG